MDNGATLHLAVSLSPETADGASAREPEFKRLTRLVQQAEAAGIDMVLLGDRGSVSRDPADPHPTFEATTLLAALATVTSRIGLVAAASPIAHQPYNLARRFASLDIISHGRAGWHLSMTADSREAANFSRPEGFSSSDYRRRSEEYIGIVQGLWQGWDADALLFDKQGGRFHDPEKMHRLDHMGEFFSVRGPLNVARSAQDKPVLVMSGLSEPDMDIAARCADIILLDDTSVDAAKTYQDLQRRVAMCGRAPNAVKVLATIAPEPGHERALGERLEHQFRSKQCDGFNIQLLAHSSALGDLVDVALPELRRRGLVQAGHRGTTLREHLGLIGGDAQ
jgi:alkanesulfonate monooxygenase SsuD/methylene tetrahydromethanopterin reductase-like flavin-dependent oxidoreductase (luciferase family)